MAVDRAYDRMGTGLVLGLLGIGALIGVAISIGYAVTSALRWVR